MPMATGIMIEMIDIGPRPGSMPMKVPIRQPPITIKRLVSEKAVESPMRIPSSTFFLLLAQPGPPVGVTGIGGCEAAFIRRAIIPPDQPGLSQPGFGGVDAHAGVLRFCLCGGFGAIAPRLHHRLDRGASLVVAQLGIGFAPKLGFGDKIPPVRRRGMRFPRH